jgi:hypothetical protein
LTTSCCKSEPGSKKSEAKLPNLQQAAEKLDLAVVLKGRGFSRAAQAPYFCHSERASAREESAVSPGEHNRFLASLGMTKTKV